MVPTFADQVAVVTGGASGIGREVALLLAERGAGAVVIADVDPAAGGRVAGEIGEHGSLARFISTDVTQESQVVAMAHETKAAFGRIDVLVNSAGGRVASGDFLDTSLETWESCIAQHLRGSFLCSREVLRVMVEQARGSIVNLASVAAFSGNPGNSIHYAASKGGVISLTLGLAREFAGRGIRVNALAPGAIDTPFHDKFSTPEWVQRAVAMTPMGRIGTAREVAEVVCFLCSGACPYLTGAVIRIDGGMVA